MFKNLLETFLDIIFPPACANCGKLTSEPVCSTCREKIQLIKGHICEFCGKPTSLSVDSCRECRNKKLSFDSARSAMVYDGAGKELVQAFKFRNDRRLSDFFALLMADALEFKSADLITWVPIHPRKRAKRGFDQSRLLAIKLGVILNIPAVSILTKSKNTEDQAGLELVERRKNVKNAFKINRIEQVKKSILLIDDVYTTGSTLHECAKIIKKAGASRVDVLTAARAVLYG